MVVSVADCCSATVLVALVAEDLGAGPAAVAGCIGF
jgi:ClpP class serine protease